jgi:RNA polymerase-binding transcription factor DksA
VPSGPQSAGRRGRGRPGQPRGAAGLELRTRERYRKRLAKIDAASERIADGSFGYCEETGEPIGVGRLLARPIATLSVETRERHEQGERQGLEP